ncbi:glycosyltransferase [Candidatus Pelagibacter sp.]|uniref:glycosyltransferase n=1 Tax=Candidatus Pelagibacter sp. TaxID=2024849 RepID=UPI003F87ADF3
MSKCIIIPAFNEYENINILLKEIYKNDFKDLIIIIIDDSDESFEKYIQKQEDSIVYLFRGKKLGRGSARQRWSQI